MNKAAMGVFKWKLYDVARKTWRTSAKLSRREEPLIEIQMLQDHK